MSDLELPGMEDIERVELPWTIRTTPRYSIAVEVRTTVQVEFETWDDPAKWLESDEHVVPLLDRAAPCIDISDTDWDNTIYEQCEDGTWKPVNADTYERIREHQERAA